MLRQLLPLLFLAWRSVAFSQSATGSLGGRVTSSEQPVAGANAGFESLQIGSSTDLEGIYCSEYSSEQNIKLTKQLGSGVDWYASVKNLFNYTQENPIIAPDRPFSDAFATDHVYGPMQARRMLLGIRYELQ